MERNGSFENSWADQWDSGADSGKNSKSGGNKKTLEKTKAMAATGLKKVKQGTASGFNWIKVKYQNRKEKH